MPFKITADAMLTTPMMITAQSQFANCVFDLFRQIRPTRIIETGTFVGTGTTYIIGQSLRHWQINDARFFSIEVNPAHHAAAVQNVRAAGIKATLLLGLSIPRRLLPSIQDINKNIVEQELDGVYVDHRPAFRAAEYFRETDFPNVEDDLLGKCLKQFDGQPDFLLLDSAGHMGNVEFNYVVPLLHRRCFFALDDTNHVKHFESVRQMKADKRFRILFESHEKFGFCFAEFNP